MNWEWITLLEIAMKHDPQLEAKVAATFNHTQEKENETLRQHQEHL